MKADSEDFEIASAEEKGKIEERASMLHQAHKAGLTTKAIAEMFQLPEAEVEKVLTGKP